jgi:hypothetical protein
MKSCNSALVTNGSAGIFSGSPYVAQRANVFAWVFNCALKVGSGNSNSCKPCF